MGEAGRPKSTFALRGKIVPIRLTQEERELLLRSALADNFPNLASWIRKVALEVATQKASEK